MKRILIWLVTALMLGALLLTDFLPMFASAQELPLSVVPGQAVAQQIAGERIHVAQQQKKKRKTLMDLLFGDDQEQQRDEPAVERPVKRVPKEAAVPAKPVIEKAVGATRLAVFGDSMAVDVAKALDRMFAEDPNIVIISRGIGSSSFVRPDFHDFNAEARAETAANSFDLAVVIIGINDRQKMRLNGESYGSLTPEWSTEYSARVSDFVTQLRNAGKPTIWIGLPPMDPGTPKFSNAMAKISEIQKLAVFAGGAEFLDITERFLTEEGKYSAFGPDLNGNRVRMRKDDGIHFTAAGADKVAFYLQQTLKLYYRGGGSVGLEVADPLLGTDAQLMVRPPYQGLGQMTLLEVAGAVISLTHQQRRAMDLVTPETAQIAPAAFDMSMLIDAPVGRVDAFGVGKLPKATVEHPGGR